MFFSASLSGGKEHGRDGMAYAARESLDIQATRNAGVATERADE